MNQKQIKRVVDIVISTIVLILTAPLLLIAAIIIILTMGRPLIFTHVRPGYLGKPFTVYKFRTMEDVYTGVNPTKMTKRLTNTGKFLRFTSLDELPQLINVIKGDMSLVGPRPLRMEYLPIYSKEQARRHDVKPGITGWAQINGRNVMEWEDRFKLDVWYVDNWCLKLDFLILCKTAIKVIKQEGVNYTDNAVSSPFQGSENRSGDNE